MLFHHQFVLVCKDCDHLSSKIVLLYENIMLSVWAPKHLQFNLNLEHALCHCALCNSLIPLYLGLFLFNCMLHLASYPGHSNYHGRPGYEAMFHGVSMSDAETTFLLVYDAMLTFPMVCFVCSTRLYPISVSLATSNNFVYLFGCWNALGAGREMSLWYYVCTCDCACSGT